MSVANRLSGKTAIVTGAGQTPGETIGNGRAIAQLLGKAGANIVCVDRVAERAQETVQDILSGGGQAISVEADVTQQADIDEMVSQTITAYERIDVLVNNVGIGGRGDGPLTTVSDEAFDLILDVNLKSALQVIKAVWPLMERDGGGSIVNISSVAAIAGFHQMAYEASKAGMDRVTRHAALLGAPLQIRCNTVAPGLMDTPIAIEGIAKAQNKSTDEVRAARNARVPMKRMGTAWDTAYAVLFLASDEASFISGETMRVDGGQGARIG